MNIIRFLAKLSVLLIGLLLIYLALAQVIQATKKTLHDERNGNASATILRSYISTKPFGESVLTLKHNSQAFYNMDIRRTQGSPCYVSTSWRWVLHDISGNSVMWNSADGEFFSGDATETLSQAFDVPAKLIPGKYTLSRLAVLRCGDDTDYARIVRNIDLIVE